jgi:hypothetical protein
MKSAGEMLVNRLQQAGLLAVLSLPGDGGLRAYDWEKMLPQIPTGLAELWRFFLLGGALPTSRLVELAGDSSLEFLKRHRLCTETAGRLSLGTLSLVYFKRMCFFIERTARPRAYFGEDTKALMTLLPAGLEKGKCLACYPGTGAQVLPLAGSHEVEFSFAHGQFEPGIIQANLEMNGGGPGVFPKSISRARRCYDLIIAAPPSTFEPPGVKMPALVAGGRDGLKRVGEVLSLASKALAPAGELCMIFIFYGPRDSAAANEKLRAFLDPKGLDYQIILCSKHSLEPGVPVFNMLLGSAAADRPQQAPQIAEKMARHLKRMAVDTAYLVKARFRLPAEPNRREIIDFSDLYYGSWTF